VKPAPKEDAAAAKPPPPSSALKPTQKEAPKDGDQPDAKADFKKNLNLKLAGPPVAAKPPPSTSEEPVSSTVSKPEVKSEQPKPAPVKAQPPPPVVDSKPKCKAAFDYTAEAEGELTFKENDIITIRTKDESGWWQGELGEAVGWFPANFVEEIPAETVPPIAIPEAQVITIL
jgi:hypothetical protein